MKDFTFYRTYSMGGMEGKTHMERNFETEQEAREFALNDTWEDSFELYKVTMTGNGRIYFEEENMGYIPCGHDIKREKAYENGEIYWKPLTNWTGWKERMEV